MSYLSFQDMPVWKTAFDLSIEIFDLTLNLPRCEDYSLTSQLRRSACSISACIAEGFGRKTNKDKSHFYIILRGSAFETQNHLLYGIKVKYFEDKTTNEIIERYNELIYQLNKLIKSLNS